MFVKRFLMPSLLVAFAATAWVGCDKEDEAGIPENRYTLSGTASGAQEVPAVTTNGTGTVAGKYNATDKTLEYTVTWSGLTENPTMMHFHGPADTGTNAGVMIPIEGFTAAPAGSKSGTATLTPSQDSALLMGKMYYNVHTATNPGGEIRAQIGVVKD